MTLLDRIIPPEALRWGRLTRSWPWVAEHGVDPMMIPPGVSVRCMLPGCPDCPSEDRP